ncbi:(Fe-S)-binding protein [Candidatus Sumerlaeota bacterium]|nr:(Fe-S)-binding protein [Candidatus Sumerlaeota bacterium]
MHTESPSHSLDLVDQARRRASDPLPSAFQGVDIPRHGDIINCMHCGLCLPHCPTYTLTGEEKHSPRGRIRLIKTIAEGGLEITPGFVESMHFCLLCRACETACPAGVKYGELAEAARAQIEISGVLRSRKRSILRALLLRGLLTRPRLLRVVARLLWINQWTFQALARRTGLMRLMPRRLRELDALAPRIPGRFTRAMVPETVRPEGKPRCRVGLLQGCLADVVYPELNHDAMQVLRHHGCEVVMPRGQTCCGSLLGHNGELEAARRQARRLIEVFERAEVDWLVITTAGCGSFIREYGHLLSGDPDWAERARALAQRVRDISEILVELGPRVPTVPIHRRLTYHEACHLRHGQGIAEPPRQLLALIPGLEIVELPESSWCCGSAGIYNITNTDDAEQLLERKMKNIVSTGADLIATGNPGCMGQIQHGCRSRGLALDVVHPITLLRESYGLPGPPSGLLGRPRRPLFAQGHGGLGAT